MEKRFFFNAPQQLKEIELLVKEGSVVNVARVWSAARRKGEKTAWDGKIGVSFYTQGRERLAVVFRVTIGDEMKEIAKLKYTPALKWCNEHLCAPD